MFDEENGTEPLGEPLRSEYALSAGSRMARNEANTRYSAGYDVGELGCESTLPPEIIDLLHTPTLK